MKSQVNAVWIASASMLAIIGVLSFSLAYQVQSVLRGQNERTIIEAINEMEFVKKALPQAAVYSSYQAGYEILKYGGYSSQGCTPEKFNNIPYWKVNDNECFPNNLNQDLARNVKERMEEYLKDLREEASKIKIEIPEYQSMAIELKGEEITVQASANEKIKFLIEGLELSDSPNIKTTVKLRIADLINKGIEIFRDKNPVKEQIVLAEQSISNACKKITYEKCFTPTEKVEKSKKELLDATCPNVLVDFEDSIKKNILGLNRKFDTKDIDVTLETNNDLIQTHVDSDIEKETCKEEKQPDFRGKLSDGSTCDCIRWVCPQPNQVKVGDQERKPPIGDFIVGAEAGKPNAECTTCFSIEGGNCIQYSDKICFEGAPQNGFCKVEVNPSCNAGSYNSLTNDCRISATCSGALNGATDVCEASPDCPIGGDYSSGENACVLTASEKVGCPDGFTQVACFGGECVCHTSDTCSTGALDGVIDKCLSSPRCPIGTGYDTENDNCKRAAFCSRGSLDTATDRCVDSVDKRCPLGTEEYQGTGRCYNTPSASSEPVCNLHKTLYTKTCDYNYRGQAATLVNLEDTQNRYPVYDQSDEKTDFRNLELQFYVLSKN